MKTQKLITTEEISTNSLLLVESHRFRLQQCCWDGGGLQALGKGDAATWVCSSGADLRQGRWGKAGGLQAAALLLADEGSREADARGGSDAGCRRRGLDLRPGREEVSRVAAVGGSCGLADEGGGDCRAEQGAGGKDEEKEQTRERRVQQDMDCKLQGGGEKLGYGRWLKGGVQSMMGKEMGCSWCLREREEVSLVMRLRKKEEESL